MGIDNYPKVRPGIFSVGRKNGKDFDSSTDSGEVKGKDLSDSNKEEGNTRVARDLREVDARYSFRGNKLRVYPQNEDEL